MKTILAMIAALSLACVASAADLTVNVGGKDSTVQYRVVDREISEKDRNTGSQGSAIDCSLLYYSLLAKDDIAGAARLSTDPAAASATWKAYRERVGAADFRNEMAAYFTSKNRVVAEFVFADETMLLVKTPEYTAGQFYRKVNDKHYVVAGRPSSEASRVLGKVLNDYKDGKIRL